MISIVVVTHGNMAEGLLHAARMIIGEIPVVTAVSLQENQGITGLEVDLQNAIQSVDQGQGVLILVDMLGASPFNFSAKVAGNDPDIEVVTGVNLPMLLETLIQRDDLTLAELAATAVQSGRDSIHDLTTLLNR
jgi:mannose PTS system EIIA component